jgi:hypothetical protein
MSAAHDRRAVREAVAAGLTPVLVGDGGDEYPVEALFAYRPGDFNKASPVVLVTSGGTTTRQLTARGTAPSYFINVFTLVLRGAKDNEESEEDYSEQVSEDILDEIADLIEQWVADNPTSEAWQSIEYDGRSQVGIDPFIGEAYWVERTTLRVEAL